MLYVDSKQAELGSFPHESTGSCISPLFISHCVAQCGRNLKLGDVLI